MKYTSHSIAVTEYETREGENTSKAGRERKNGVTQELRCRVEEGHRHPSIDVFSGADAGGNIYSKGEVIAGRERGTSKERLLSE